MESKQTGGEVNRPVRRARNWRWTRWLGMALVLLVVFSLGVNVGNGRFSLHNGNSLNGSLPSTPDYTTVNQVYKSLIENYNGKLTESQLENGLKHGLAESTGDPYTEYFTPAEAKAFNQQLNNQFSGIGAELGEDSDGNLQVIAPIPNAPAAQAGLQAQDLIASIDGTSTSGMTPDQAVTKIRGKADTKVTLQIIRNKSTPMTITITRQNITVPSVTTKMLDGNIGYMQISTFADDTSGLAQKAAQEFKQKNVKAVILDLRNNPGGEVPAAVDVSSLWVKPGQTIVSTKGTTGNQTTMATGNDPLNGIPTVVLINGGSASASEITTGALHDNKDAYVIGQKSYGKGVEQTLISFGDGSQLKVTTASWYRPDGQSINHKGITPDQAVALPSGTSVTIGGANDTQLQAAEDYLASH